MGRSAASLGKRLFNARLELIGELESAAPDCGVAGGSRRLTPIRLPKPRCGARVAEILQREVAAMNVENFIVRPKRRLVEKFAKPEAWTT